jgi:hypothetical protein
VFALPQATLRSPAVMKIKPFGHHSTSKKIYDEEIWQSENFQRPLPLVT